MPKKGKGRGRGRGADPKSNTEYTSPGRSDQSSGRAAPGEATEYNPRRSDQSGGRAVPERRTEYTPPGRSDQSGGGTVPERRAEYTPPGRSDQSGGRAVPERRTEYTTPGRSDQSGGGTVPERRAEYTPPGRSDQSGGGAKPKRKTKYTPPGQSDQSDRGEYPSSSGTDPLREQSKSKPRDLEKSTYSDSHPQFKPSSSSKDEITPVAPSKVRQELALSPVLPKRPSEGSKGRPIRVISNCFPIDFPSGYVYHYDVEIIGRNQQTKASKESKIKKINRKVIELMLDNDPKFRGLYGVYNGQKSLYLRKELKSSFPVRSVVNLSDECARAPDDPRGPKENTYEVYIKPASGSVNLDSIHAWFAGRISSVPCEAIMALETILRHGPSLKFTPLGRSFYFPPHPNDLTPLGGGLEIWFGYHQSVLLSQWKATVNIDIAATTFLQAGPVLKFIADSVNMNVDQLRNYSMAEKIRKKISKKLEKRSVEVTHLKYPRRYRVIGLTQKSANEELVDEKQGLTVADYFRNQHKKNLQFSNLPCLQVAPPNRKIYLPIEVCNIVPGQHSKANLNPSQKTKMIQFTSTPPRDRFEKIQDIVRKSDFRNDKRLQHFGVKVSNQPLNADGRVLDAPILAYSDKEIEPRDGSWNLRSTRFLKGAKVPPWVVITFQRNHKVKDFCNLFFSVGKNLDMKVNQKYEIINLRESDIYSDKVKLFENIKQKGFELAIIVIPPDLENDEEKKLYANIKRAAETAIGLATQCIKDVTMSKVNPQIVNNLCLKINAKLGGENNSMASFPKILSQPVIIIGADVNHPAPGEFDEPSLAACVGSLDSFCKRVAVCVRPQENSDNNTKKLEIIKDIEEMVKELLLAFYRHTNQKPTKIIFYRDGVSEGEIEYVKKYEIAGVRKACLSLQKDYKPGITCILVQKRHHVRFRPQNPREGAGRMQNIPPGTVIDKDVTHPTNFDFYLCSQFGLQGTSRPSHYTVVEDDNNFSADDLQELTYQLCHMCVRCTKSISIPAPVAYADLAAYRARKYLEAEKRTSGQHSQGFQKTRIVKAIEIVQGLQNSMYFV